MFNLRDRHESWRANVRRLFLSVFACFIVVDTIAAQPGSLFIEASNPAAAHALDKRATQDVSIIRSRYIQVKLGLLLRKLNSATSPSSITSPPDQKIPIALNLFPDVAYVAINDRVQVRGAGNFSWFGHIDGVPHSQVTLVVRNGLLTGNIHAYPGELYQIRPLKKGKKSHVIYKIDENALPKFR